MLDQLSGGRLEVSVGRGISPIELGYYLPLLGMSRHVVIADTNREALASARRAYAQWYAKLVHLWPLHGVAMPLPIPPDADDAIAAGFCIAGAPATVGSSLLEETGRAGVSYLIGRFALSGARASRGDAAPSRGRRPCSARRSSRP